MLAKRPTRTTGATRGTRRDQGFTLVEVMVAALLLLVALAGIVPFFLTGLSQASTVRFKSLATNIAREKMEEIRQLDYREIYTQANVAEANARGDHSLNPNRTLEHLFDSSVTERNTAFAVNYVVNPTNYVDGTQAGTLKEVTVNVTWTAPHISPASITTLVHQQYLGPRGSLLELSPTLSDPLGTPFRLIAGSGLPTTTKALYYIAQADWNLVLDGVDTGSPSARDVYMRLALFDDNGQSIALGDLNDDFKIDNTHLHSSRGDDGKVDAVWFEYDFNNSAIPDGYWEVRAVAFNQYQEPGNVWRLRFRVERGEPAAPTSLTATPQADNETIVLNWAGGAERDRVRYKVQRRDWDGTQWSSWSALTEDLDPIAGTYANTGDVPSGTAPWGDASHHNSYEYAVSAVDISGLEGPAATVVVTIPPVVVTTTSSTTSTTTVVSTTTTTAPSSFAVQLKNISNANYSVVILNGTGGQAYSGNLNKNKTITVSGLNAGYYLITATTTVKGKPKITQSFSVPAQAGSIVLTIL